MANQGIGAWPHRRRMKSAGRHAIMHNDVGLTYDELADRVDRLADALADRGVGRGDRVAYLGNNHPSLLETLFACGLLGAVFVPLNTRLVAAELAQLVDDSEAVTLICTDALEALALAALAASSGGVQQVAVVGRSILDVSAETSRIDYDELLNSGRTGHRELEVGLDEPAMIIYTSGTTGRPKGAVLTHGNLTWNCFNVLTDYDVHSDERSLMIAPLFHVASLGMGCLPTLLKGGTVILAERFEAGEALELIERHRVTSVSGVPTTFQLLSEHPRWQQTDLSSLRSLTCGGSPAPARVREAFEQRGVAFSSGYGMTEAAAGVTSLQPRYSLSNAGSVGLPHFFADVRIADEHGGAVPIGMPGEIQAQGQNTITRYWNDPVATAALRTADGWLKTGDVGYIDEDGFVHVADRIKDMIISGGENIYPAEVESVLMELPEFRAVAVVGRASERWGEVPHAVVVLADGAVFDHERAQAQLAGRLARYKIPRTFEVVAELPRTASGKVRKHLLR